jgi:hypothetical protein
MAGFDAHVDQADRNAEFLKACDTYFRAQYIEWIVVIRFYICLHIVEAIYGTLPIPRHFKDHKERNRILPMFIGNLYDQAFCEHYLDLYQLSQQARYDTNKENPLTPADINSSEISFNHIIEYARKRYRIVLNNISYPSSTTLPVVPAPQP